MSALVFMMQLAPILTLEFTKAWCITIVPSEIIECFETYENGEIKVGKVKPILLSLSNRIILRLFDFKWPTVIKAFYIFGKSVRGHHLCR